jgi:hypothetical protein
LESRFKVQEWDKLSETGYYCNSINCNNAFILKKKGKQLFNKVRKSYKHSGTEAMRSNVLVCGFSGKICSYSGHQESIGIHTTQKFINVLTKALQLGLLRVSAI